MFISKFLSFASLPFSESVVSKMVTLRNIISGWRPVGMTGKALTNSLKLDCPTLGSTLLFSRGLRLYLSALPQAYLGNHCPQQYISEGMGR